MKKIISAALLTLAVGGANAQAYVGGSLGMSKLDLDCTGASHCDDTDVGYKAYIGYADPTSKHFALEAGVIDFGEAKAGDGLTNIAVETQAFYGAVAVRWSFTPNFGGAARLGFATVKTTCSAAVGPYFGSDSETDTSVLVGFGLSYAITKNLKAVASIDGTKADCNGSSGTVALLSAGAQYSF